MTLKANIMKTIKFRGKRKNWNPDYGQPEWKFGNLLNNTSIGEVGYDMDNYEYSLVIPETIGQFTGLTDKNGNEIFEGDIIRSVFSHNKTHQEIIGIIEWDSCNPCFVIHYKWQGDGHDCYEYDFVQCGLRKNEIIGNIHDSPELLK